MLRRLPPIVLALLAAAAAAAERPARIPLDPAGLAGPDVFPRAEGFVARAAETAGARFVADPRPLPPQVVQILDTPGGDLLRSGALLFWRGEMLPDQLAPGETGTLVRRRPAPGGGWKSTRVRENDVLSAHTNFVPAVRFGLPATLIETAYHLGTVGDAPALLVLWRSTEEDSAPLAGFIALQTPDPALADALRALVPPFETKDEWLKTFDALSR